MQIFNHLLSKFFFFLYSFFAFVLLSVKKIECIEGVHFAIFLWKHHTGTLYRSDIEIIAVHEGYDEDTEDVIVAEFLRESYIWKTAKKTRKTIGSGFSIF